jgi:hypothetical protein
MIGSGLAKFGFFGTALTADVAMPFLMTVSALAQDITPTPTTEVVAYNENGTVIAPGALARFTPRNMCRV